METKMPDVRPLKGWIYALGGGSNWGSIEDFHRVIAGDDPKDLIVIDSAVWGKMANKGLQPRPGDGFAFYHTKRAIFPLGDPHHRRQRISLIGELREIQFTGQEVHRIRVSVDINDFRAMRDNPIVRDETTEEIFQMAGLIRGRSASLFEVPPPAWDRILSLLKSHRDALRSKSM
jgi:hypothetical protein